MIVFYMLFPSENHTRMKLLLLIKKSGGMSVDELSRHLGITPMGVRQHLLALEKRGILKFVPKKHGVGRPKFLYVLTQKGSTIFPHSYDRLATDILRHLTKTAGRTMVDTLFKKRKEALLTEKESILPDRTNFRSRVAAMAEILNADGYLVELEETDKDFKIKKFHCPISQVATEFKDPCKYELELYRELLHSEVSRERWQVKGDTSCTYVIPKPRTKGE